MLPIPYKQINSLLPNKENNSVHNYTICGANKAPQIVYFRAMRYIYLFVSILITFSVTGQNLVPNPGFESYAACGYNLNIAYSCAPLNPNVSPLCYGTCCANYLPLSPYNIGSGTDNWWSIDQYLVGAYFNACAINWMLQQSVHNNINTSWYIPRTGKAFIMMVSYLNDGYNDSINYRTYAQVKLTEPLKAGCTYELSYYAMLSRNLNYSNYFNSSKNGYVANVPSDGLGIYVSKDSLFNSLYNNNTVSSFLPGIIPHVSNPSGHMLSDSMHYQKISGTYKAEGGEQWLAIGNFKDNAHTQVLGDSVSRTSVYSIDDVSLALWEPDLLQPKDTTVCSLDTLILTLPTGLTNLKWSTGDISNQLQITKGGTYTVTAGNGCKMLYDTIQVHMQAPYSVHFSIGQDTFLCEIPDSYMLKAPAGFNLYKWSTGSTTQSTNINNPGAYWLNASYVCGTLSDTITITAFQNPDTLIIPYKGISLCSNQSLTMKVNNNTLYKRFTWSNGSTLDSLTINQPGKYSLTAITDKGCIVKDSLAVTVIYPPAPIHFPDTLVCEASSLTLTIPVVKGNQINWHDGSSEPFHVFNSSGTYWLKEYNRCYQINDTIKISFLDCSLDIPNLITVNGDGHNEYFEIKTNISRLLEVSIYTSWGSRVFQNPDYKNEWNANGLEAGIYYYQVSDSLMHQTYKGWLQVIK